MHLKMSSGKWRPFCLGLNVSTLLALSSHSADYKVKHVFFLITQVVMILIIFWWSNGIIQNSLHNANTPVKFPKNQSKIVDQREQKLPSNPLAWPPKSFQQHWNISRSCHLMTFPSMAALEVVKISGTASDDNFVKNGISISWNTLYHTCGESK